MERAKTRAAACATLLLLLGGCMVGPDYVRPDAEVNEAWREGEGGGRVKTDEPPPQEWWKAFRDPILDNLIDRAYRQNLTLRIAGVRVLQALAARGIAVGQLFPQSQEINADFTRSKASENGPPVPTYTNSWNVSFDAAWEIDFWGKIRRAIESSNAELDATLADYDTVLVTLVSEVALTYVEIRTLQMRIAIAKANVGYQEQGIRLATERFQAGATSELDPTQVKSLASQTRASIPSLEILLKQAAYRLSFLLGSTPGGILETIGDPKALPTAPPSIAVGIPADLLRRRPDVRFAERRAAAQSARIGVARAEMYPAFFLSGSVGFAAGDVSDLFNGGSWTGGITPGFSWPVFNYGRLKNNVRVQDAGFQAELINYRNAVLAAAQEVESNLADFVGSRDREVHLLEAVTQSEKALELSQLQYSEGTVDFQRVLDALSSLRLLQDALVVTQGQVVASVISTHKSLGGGWELRQGMEIVPEDTRKEMDERTDWDGMLDPAFVDGKSLIPRHDPTKQAN